MLDAPGVGEGQPLATETTKVPSHSNPWKNIYSSETIPGKKLSRNSAIQKAKERKEAVTTAALEIAFDKDKLFKIVIPQSKPRSGYRHEEGQQQQIAHCLDGMKRLPERLSFQPGITLIVGENGSGKSTLVKSIYLAIKAREESEHSQSLSYDEILNSLLDTNSGSDSDKAFAIHAGLAKQLAPTVKLENYQQGQSTQQPYYDVPNIIGEEKQKDLDTAIDRYGTFRNLTFDDKEPAVTRSHRQTVDWVLHDLTPLGVRDNKNRPGIFFIDEPETGMSPKRQRKLEEELRSKLPEGSIALIPTNSVVLYNSDLPRIDLDFPERGIHRPSQYSVDN